MSIFRSSGGYSNEWVKELDDDTIKVEIKRLREEFKTKKDDDSLDKILDIYKTIVDTRKFEIENYWKRTLFFWGTLAIVLIGYFKIDAAQSQYKIFVAFLGFFYNIIFCLSLRGSKYWQEHWEHAATIYEKELSFRIFSWQLFKTVNSRYEKTKQFKPYKFSVSKLTMILGDITWMLFLGLVVDEVKNLINTGIISYAPESKFSIYSLSIHIFVIVGITAILSLTTKMYYASYSSKNPNRPLIIGVLLYIISFVWFDVIKPWITLFIPNSFFIWINKYYENAIEAKKKSDAEDK